MIVEMRLIVDFKLMSMCDKFMCELLIDYLFDVRLVETVFEGALIAKSKTVITFVLLKNFGLFNRLRLIERYFWQLLVILLLSDIFILMLFNTRLNLLNLTTWLLWRVILLFLTLMRIIPIEKLIKLTGEKYGRCWWIIFYQLLRILHEFFFVFYFVHYLFIFDVLLLLLYFFF